MNIKNVYIMKNSLKCAVIEVVITIKYIICHLIFVLCVMTPTNNNSPKVKPPTFKSATRNKLGCHIPFRNG